MNLFNGNCLDKIKDLDDNSVDCIITDPPYGMSFMGKDWDKALPDLLIFKECYRVLKDGAFAFVMSAPRSDLQARMSIMLEECGFDIGYTPIYWTFASGFPKGANISKKIDERFGKEREVVGIYKHPDGRERKWDEYSGGDSVVNFGHNKENTNRNITKPASEEAKKFDGSYGGFQPKPAVEVIIVAMKPLTEKTFVDQALKNGKGITWFNDCRIPFVNEKDLAGAQSLFDSHRGEVHSSCTHVTNYSKWDAEKTGDANPTGRFPANLLVSDDVLNDGQERKSPSGTVNRKPRTEGNGTWKNCGLKSEGNNRAGFGDTGSFSRYFDLDVWWRERLSELPQNVFNTYPFLIVPKPGKSEKNKGLSGEGKTVNDGRKKSIDNPFQRGETVRLNIHPTVKPIKLMSYLVTLGSREGDVVLDPFMGSGTTGIASEILNRDFIGCEWDNDYFKIAEERIKANKKIEIKSVFEW